MYRFMFDQCQEKNAQGVEKSSTISRACARTNGNISKLSIANRTFMMIDEVKLRAQKQSAKSCSQLFLSTRFCSMQVPPGLSPYTATAYPDRSDTLSGSPDRVRPYVRRPHSARCARPARL